ncbi:hypothetical protein FDENT_11161 [Fusarium denticulatum]|uniref:Uncharacterized protein n=1 Tax=Fusarium denticulatum TaxID=48507 RepID=A0A8H5TEQ7_9HYPO|nr:hypothetical protein FDENT_11161 [Fusarium denticulatum]
MSGGHSPEQAPGEQAPKRQAPGIDPKWVFSHVHWCQKSVPRLTYIEIEQEEQEYDEHRRKLTRGKEYLHWHLALHRTEFNAIDCWKSLGGSIAALLNVPSIHNATWDSLDEALQRKFISYAPNAEELFEPPTQQITTSSAIVILSPTSFHIGDIPRWISLKDSPQNVRRIDPTCVVPIIAKALGRYFPEEYDERDLANETYPVLRNLANSVVDLDFLFDANLTVFSHVFHHLTTQQTCGFPFQRKLEGIEGQAMESHYGGLGRNEEGQNVDLVVNPMLLQHGHHNGYDYEVKTAAHPMEVCVAWLEAHRNPPDSPEVDGEEEHGRGTDGATAEEKSEGHSEDDSEDEDNKEQGNEVEGLPKEEESREEVDKEEDDEAITKEGEENNKNKERADKKGDKGEEEEDQTKQKEKKTNIKNTTESKKTKKNKQKRRQQ